MFLLNKIFEKANRHTAHELTKLFFYFFKKIIIN